MGQKDKGREPTQTKIGLGGDSLDDVVPNIYRAPEAELKPGQVRGKDKVTIYIDTDVHAEVRRVCYWTGETVGGFYQKAAYHHLLMLISQQATFSRVTEGQQFREIHKPAGSAFPPIPAGARLKTGNFGRE